LPGAAIGPEACEAHASTPRPAEKPGETNFANFANFAHPTSVRLTLLLDFARGEFDTFDSAARICRRCGTGVKAINPSVSSTRPVTPVFEGKRIAGGGALRIEERVESGSRLHPAG